MVETADQVRAEIAHTRQNMAATIDEIGFRVDSVRQRIPFYGTNPKPVMILAGGLVAVSAAIFLAFYVRKQL